MSDLRKAFIRVGLIYLLVATLFGAIFAGVIYFSVEQTKCEMFPKECV